MDTNNYLKSKNNNNDYQRTNKTIHLKDVASSYTKTLEKDRNTKIDKYQHDY